MRSLAFFALLLLLPAACRSAEGEGTAGGLLARFPIGARSQAMGGAHGTLPDAPESLVVNPASLGLIESTRLSAAYHQWLEEMYYSGFMAGVPLKPWLVLGAGVEMFSAGEVEAYDHLGNMLTAELQEDRMGVAAAAARWGPFDLGASLKYYHSRIVETSRSRSFLADVGLGLELRFYERSEFLSSSSLTSVYLSAAASNIGPSISYDTETADPDSAPTEFRLGLSVARELARGRSALGALAADLPRHTGRPEMRCGLELGWPVAPFVLFTRAGVRGRPDSGQFSLGLGVRYQGMDLDYAFVSRRAPFAPTHHVSIGFNFERFRPPAAPLAR